MTIRNMNSLQRHKFDLISIDEYNKLEKKNSFITNDVYHLSIGDFVSIPSISSTQQIAPYMASYMYPTYVGVHANIPCQQKLVANINPALFTLKSKAFDKVAKEGAQIKVQKILQDAIKSRLNSNPAYSFSIEKELGGHPLYGKIDDFEINAAGKKTYYIDSYSKNNDDDYYNNFTDCKDTFYQKVADLLKTGPGAIKQNRIEMNPARLTDDDYEIVVKMTYNDILPLTSFGASASQVIKSIAMLPRSLRNQILDVISESLVTI